MITKYLEDFQIAAPHVGCNFWGLWGCRGVRSCRNKLLCMFHPYPSASCMTSYTKIHILCMIGINGNGIYITVTNPPGTESLVHVLPRSV